MNRIYVSLCFLLAGLIGWSCSNGGQYNDGYIKYEPVTVSDFDRQILLKNIAEMDKRYDLEGRMITKVIKDWNYHTDAIRNFS